MKKLLTLLLGLGCFSAIALDKHDVCNQISNNKQKIRCLKVIRSGSFDYHSLKVCNGIIADMEMVKCMKVIKNNAYHINATAVCKTISNSRGFSSDSRTIKCLKVIKNKYYDESDLYSCNSISTSLEKVRCLKKIESLPLL